MLSLLEVLLIMSLMLLMLLELLMLLKLLMLLTQWLADDWCIRGGQQRLHMQARLLEHKGGGGANR